MNTEDDKWKPWAPSGAQQMWLVVLVILLVAAEFCVISLLHHPDGNVPVRATVGSRTPDTAVHGTTKHSNPGKAGGVIASPGPFCAGFAKGESKLPPMAAIGKPSGAARKPAVQRAKPVSCMAITPVMKRAAFAYLQHKMPNSGFTGVKRDPNVPGLLDVETGKPQPVYFDPRNHALIIGLVVNLDNPRAIIAPGVNVPSAAFGP